MLNKTEKVKFQKVMNVISLKNTKGKNTTSMMDLHKTTKYQSNKSVKDLTASKHLTQSKERLEEISHKQMLQKELDNFRKEIETKYRQSKTNSGYVFPRNTSYEQENINITDEPNCSVIFKYLVKVISVSSVGPTIKLQKNSLQKSKDVNYYSTFFNIKKSQSRAENTKSRVYDTSSKLCNNLQMKTVDESKEISISSLKKILNHNINIENNRKTKQKEVVSTERTKKLKGTKITSLKSNLLTQKIDVIHMKSPMLKFKEKVQKLMNNNSKIANTNSEYFMTKIEEANRSNNASKTRHNNKRNKMTIIKSTSNLKDVAAKYMLLI